MTIDDIHMAIDARREEQRALTAELRKNTNKERASLINRRLDVLDREITEHKVQLWRANGGKK